MSYTKTSRKDCPYQLHPTIMTAASSDSGGIKQNTPS